MQDLRVQRGADEASDHHLVLARMKMKQKNREVKRSTRRGYNVDFLKTFRLTIRNKYEALQDLREEGNRHTMATDQGDVNQHIQRSSGKEEIPTKRLNFSRHCKQQPN